MLKFFGRGSAFANEHNSAYFTSHDDLILIDCPATTFQKIKHFNFDNYTNIYVLITHTHGDHVGGLGTFLQHLYFVTNRLLTVVVPSELVYNDIILLLKHIEGCEDSWFNIVQSDSLKNDWFIKAIPTEHVEPLKNKCFGYLLKIDNSCIVYTGDTNTLEPFLPYLDKNSYLYTEISFYRSNVHLYYKDILPILINLTDKGIHVFLMHLDNEQKIIEQIQNTKIKLAPLEY